MKVKYAVLSFGIVLLAFAVWFIYTNLPGLRPAFGPVPAVTRIPDQTGVPEKANTTGLPLTLPDGFSISYFARGLTGPRVLVWDPSQTLVVSIPSQGKVVALKDTNSDGVSDETVTVMGDLNGPHGLAFRDGKIYIAEIHQVAVYDYNPDTKKAGKQKKIIDLPSGGNHSTRTIGFGPDGKLYVSVGSSCNVCNEKDWRRAKILVANADGSGLHEFASGLRNSVFFVWQPGTNVMWATEMGRDLLGDNTPPEEVNRITEGGFYGWPICYNNRVHDRSFDPSDSAAKKCAESIVPHITFQAHSAPLGLAFIPDSWPKEYRGDLLVSYHGSWNRSVPTGYKVLRFDLDTQFNSIGESDFLSGFLAGGGAIGRPVGLLFDSNGALFVSDDKAGAIYRITPPR